jgi:hypothetical protein
MTYVAYSPAERGEEIFELFATQQAASDFARQAVGNGRREVRIYRIERNAEPGEVRQDLRRGGHIPREIIRPPRFRQPAGVPRAGTPGPRSLLEP